MSEPTKRQAYVFLEIGDEIKDGDECYDLAEKWTVQTSSTGETIRDCDVGEWRRPIATPEQTDGLRIEQRVTALEMQLKLIQPIKPKRTRTRKSRDRRLLEALLKCFVVFGEKPLNQHESQFCFGFENWKLTKSDIKHMIAIKQAMDKKGGK